MQHSIKWSKGYFCLHVVWGCFSRFKLGLLVPAEGNLNAAAYSDIIENNPMVRGGPV